MRIASLAPTVIASALLLCAGTVRADITTYTSQSGYLAAAGVTGIDTFDDLGFDSSTGPLLRAAGASSYTVTAGPGSPAFWGAGDDGIDQALTAQDRTDTITFGNFGGAARGAGGFFYGSDLFGFTTTAGALTLSATDSSGATASYTLAVPGRDTFVGFVSNVALVSLSVSAGDQPGVWATVNDFHVSAPVPEPSAAAMLLGGLGLLGWLARRRRPA